MTSDTAPKLKVCGITNLSDARAALDAGANWIGLIAVPNTPRFIDASTAKNLVENLRESHPSAYVVGVFQNASPTEVSAYARTVKISAIQLHGQEDPADYAHIGLPIIKVLHLHPQSKMADLQTQVAFYLQQPQVLTCLLDLPKGSGLKSILEWPNFHRLPELTREIPVMMAGGLNPDNIETVIQTLHPWGIDVASGVESQPGQKDREKLNAFCRQVKHQNTPQKNVIKESEVNTLNGEQYPCNP